MKTNRKVICSSSAVRYAETLFELNIPKETIEKTREIFSEVPQITDVLDNPTIRQEKKEQVIDKSVSAGNEKLSEDCLPLS